MFLRCLRAPRSESNPPSSCTRQSALNTVLTSDPIALYESPVPLNRAKYQAYRSKCLYEFHCHHSSTCSRSRIPITTMASNAALTGWCSAFALNSVLYSVRLPLSPAARFGSIFTTDGRSLRFPSVPFTGVLSRCHHRTKLAEL